VAKRRSTQAASASAPAFVGTLSNETAEDRKAILERVHPDYKANSVSWEILLDAFEGTGGFLDGSYLWPYPREGQNEFTERRDMARYHNYVETLVDLYVRFLWTQGVTRTSKDPQYDEWLQDVDGNGSDIDEVLRKLTAISLAGGHAGLLIDKEAKPAKGPRRIDDTGKVYATLFTNLSITDWRFTRNQLTAVKLLEKGPAPSLVAKQDAEVQNPVQYLLWDEEGFARYDAAGEFVSAGVPDLGIVPLIILRPKPSQLNQMLGRPLIGNANIVRALFNRASEEDEVMRSGAFSWLAVEVDAETDADMVKSSLGSVIGTAKALVVKGKLDYKTPDQSVPGTIRDNIQYLVQELYRNAHVRFHRDTLEAQSAESIRLQYTELNEMLQGLGKALTQAEREIARAWYGWNYGTEEQAQAAFEAAEPRADYPDEFFLDDLLTDLTAWQAAIAMDLGLTMQQRIKKRAARRVDPDLDPDTQKKVDDEIDAQPPPMTEQERLGLVGGAGGGGGGGDTGNPEADVARERKTKGAAA